MTKAQDLAHLLKQDTIPQTVVDETVSELIRLEILKRNLFKTLRDVLDALGKHDRDKAVNIILDNLYDLRVGENI